MIVKTKKNQIFGAYGYLRRNQDIFSNKNFYFNISNNDIKTNNISLKLYNDRLVVYPCFQLGKDFFKSQNLIYADNIVFSCEEVEVFDIIFQ